MALTCMSDEENLLIERLARQAKPAPFARVVKICISMSVLLAVVCAALWNSGTRTSGSTVAEVADVSSLMEQDQLKQKLEATLESLIFDKDGEPNPRIVCSAGNFDVRKLLAEKLENLGLKKLDGHDSFVIELANSADEELCKNGIANVAGYVEGTDKDLKEEYILIDAHFDGPRNQGPDEQLGNGVTMDPYDDGGAVAAVLLLAEEFQKRPPKRSIIFFFSDGEEGCSQLERPLPPTCSEGPVPGSLLGFRAMVGDAVLSKVKLMLGADPWGKPGVRGSDFVVVMGADATPDLQSLIEKYWPQGAHFTQPVFASRAIASVNSWNGDWASRFAQPEDRIPALWMPQTGFQSYHGGLNSFVVEHALFPAFDAMNISLQQHATAYYTLDTMCSFDLDALTKIQMTVSSLLRSLANSEELSEVKASQAYSYQEPHQYSLQDVKNTVKSYGTLIQALEKGHGVTGIPAAASHDLIKGIEMTREHLKNFLGSSQDLLDKRTLQSIQLQMALFVGIDFFKDTLLQQGLLVELDATPLALPECKKGRSKDKKLN